MPETIKASEQNLNNIFSDAYFFEIPQYQRPYAWNTEQVDDLLDDLLSAMDRDEQSPYFLGSIVLIKNERDPKSDVVDGQQRLTTLTMLFCVLRDLATGKDQTELDDFVRQQGNSARGTQDRWRLTVRERDKSFFCDNVQVHGSIEEFINKDSYLFSDSQQLFQSNIDFLNRKLSALGEARRKSFVDFVAQQCYLVVVTATDRDAAYRIFSVMNDRGLDLSPTDILKAKIIGEISTSSQDGYSQKWENIEERIGRDGFRDLFTHIRMIKLKTKLRTTLQQDFQDSVLVDVEGAEFIDNILEPYAGVYETLLDASYESSQGAEEVNRYLDYLRQLDNFDWFPPAMAFFLHCSADCEVLVRFIKDLERLAYGLFVWRANVNNRVNRYGEVLREIERGDDLFRIDSPLQLNAEEKSRFVSALDGQIYLQTPVRQTLLKRLDSLLAGTGAKYEHKVITVEHVLPQNPHGDSEWVAWFPDREIRDSWTHRLANLVLLSRRKNSSASNLNFQDKKEKYFKSGSISPFVLTTSVLNETEWTPEVLERRQRELIQELSREWRCIVP